MATYPELASESRVESTETVDGAGVAKISDLKSEMKMEQFVVDMSKLKLNPMAKEFIPAALLRDRSRNKFSRRNTNNNNRKWRSSKVFDAQREDSVRRTVYVSGLDQHVTEERLADLFSLNCGPVADCRICGDPKSRLRFAFVEFDDERSVSYAIHLSGIIIGYYPIKVLPSKTAILPVNPTFLPRSENEKELCTRTVYCTNIDKNVSQDELKSFFESSCGVVSQLKLLGNNTHSTYIAFVEFEIAECAIEALNCSGKLLGTLHIRVSPSKTPVRPMRANRK